jgi:hypothetical protein
MSSAIVANDWSHLWIYVLAPLTGGAIAVGFAWILRGPPTIAADRSVQGLNANDARGDPRPGSAP